MLEFDLKAYESLLNKIKEKYSNILTVREYFKCGKLPEVFCIIRHDVDRRPSNALKTAELEKKYGIKASYYFRKSPSKKEKNIILKISEMGHETGFHFECLSDARGNRDKAEELFKKELKKLREIVSVETICMHGSPFSAYDNRVMWEGADKQKELIEKYGILGEVYCHIDFMNVVYLTDTGRSWKEDASNIRDHAGKAAASLKSGGTSGLIEYLEKSAHANIMINAHPERWNAPGIPYMYSYLFDTASGIIKMFLAQIRKKRV
ncbi:MAG: hypothetical protein ACLFQK_04035 [Fibrobacterota bacterium]